MADVSPKYGTASSSVESDGTRSYSITYVVKGDALKTELGNFIAENHSDVPARGDTITYDDFTYIMQSKSTERVAPEVIEVECNYEVPVSENSGPSDQPSSEPEGDTEEEARRWTYGCPYNERMDKNLQEVESRLLVNQNHKVIPSPEPITLRRALPVWKFDINITPHESFHGWTGAINTEVFPPSQTYLGARPFCFAPNRLLFTGASGSVLDVPSLPDVDGVEQPFVWKYTFSFIFNPYQSWWFATPQVTRKVDAQIFPGDAGIRPTEPGIFFYNYWREGEGEMRWIRFRDQDGRPYSSVPYEMDAPVLKKMGEGRYAPILSGLRVPDRERDALAGDFAPGRIARDFNDWGFNWEPLTFIP